MRLRSVRFFMVNGVKSGSVLKVPQSLEKRLQVWQEPDAVSRQALTQLGAPDGIRTRILTIVGGALIL